MLFDDLSDEVRASAIRFLEESLFGASTIGAHYFQDLPPPMPGFNVAASVRPMAFKVTVSPEHFRKK